MIKIFTWGLLAVLVFIAQTQFSFLHNSINLTVVIVYFFGLRNLDRVAARGYFGSRSEIETTAFGAFIGLTEDILLGSLIGPGFLSKGLIGFFTSVIFSDVVFRWTPIWGVTAITAFTLLDGLILIGARNMFTDLNVNSTYVLLNVLVQIAVNVPFGILLKPRDMD